MKKNLIASIALLITIYFFITKWFEIHIPMGILITFITLLWILAFIQFNTVSALKILLIKQNNAENVINANTLKRIILFNVLALIFLLFIVGNYIFVVRTFEPFLIIFCIFFLCHLFIIFRTLTFPKQLINETQPVTAKLGNLLKKDKVSKAIQLMAILVFLSNYISKLKVEKTILSGSLLILFYTLLFAYVFLQERIENSKYKMQIIVIGIIVMIVLLAAFTYLTGII